MIKGYRIKNINNEKSPEATGFFFYVRGKFARAGKGPNFPLPHTRALFARFLVQINIKEDIIMGCSLKYYKVEGHQIEISRDLLII